jgi:hypothetical protein
MKSLKHAVSDLCTLLNGDDFQVGKSLSDPDPHSIVILAHARFENVSQHVVDRMKCRFDWGKPYLAVCVWMVGHTTPRRDETYSRKVVAMPRKPSHYAALWGLHTVIEFLVIEHSQNDHSRAFVD